MKAQIIPDKLTYPHVMIPSSKSLSHRALIAASLAKGTSLIHNLVENDDTEATMGCLKHLGARFERQGDDLLVQGIGGTGQYDGEIVDCRESGSTLRFLIPLFALSDQEVIFTGRGRLMQRPQDVYENIFREQGLKFVMKDNLLKIQGPLSAGEYHVNGGISSQFISGLLFALPLLHGDSRIIIAPPFASASYVNLTADALKRASISVAKKDLSYEIRGNQMYKPFEGIVEGDASQAAFYAVLSAVTKTPFLIHNMNHDSHQGDAVILDIMKQFGAGVEEIADGYQIIPHDLKAAEVDLEDCPDLGPALFALATQAEGKSIFRNAGRLRIKESDRIQAMEEELRKLGCSISSDNNTVYVEGMTKLKGGVDLCGHNDHRIVMALSVLSSGCEKPVMIHGAEAVNKSYPQFYDHLKKTGIGVNLYD